MSNTKISALLEKAIPLDSDFTVIVDSVDGLNKKITLGSIVDSLAGPTTRPNVTVDTYALLPTASLSNTDDIIYVTTQTGTFLLGTRKKRGLYRSNGVTWEYAGDNTRDWSDIQNKPNIIQETYETVSKNLNSWDADFNYSLGNLVSIIYSNGISTINKTFNYTGSDLTSIVLSGDTPSGISLTKTLIYTSGELTGVTYS